MDYTIGFLVAVLAVAVLSGATATVVGFGIGSLLTPLLGVHAGIAGAVAARHRAGHRVDRRLAALQGGMSGKDAMETTMRQATPDDAERLSAIARSAKASWGYPEAWLRAWDSALRITRNYIERNAVFVLAQGREAIGFYALEDRGAHWLLEHLWVDPSQHRRGAGRRLFLHALERVRALQPGVVVIESDPNAVGFYTKMGAVPTGALAAPVVGDASRTLPVLEIRVDASGP